MAKPTILAVDDDPGASRAIARDLSTRYGADYAVVRATSGTEGLAHLARLALQDRRVALVISDQRMPGMTGIEMPQEVRVVGHPWAEHTYEVKTFLTRNHVPYRWLDVEHDDEATGSSTWPAST